MKMRPEDQVAIWAKRPDVFELEPKHVRARFAAQVEAEIKKMKATESADASPEPSQAEPMKKPATKARMPAKKK